MSEVDEKDLVIDSSNFAQYFFDVRRFGPKEGQIMAKFSAAAIFGDGPEKRDLIKILRKDKAEAAAMVMRKIHCAREPDCYRICREMVEDMIKGMTDDEVAKKEYEFILEAFYYTKREYIPVGDPHWETLDLVQYDPETKTFKVNISLPEVPGKNLDQQAK